MQRFRRPRTLTLFTLTAFSSWSGLIDLLAFALSTSHASPHGRTSEAYLATDQVEHVATRVKDYGWGCGCVNRLDLRPLRTGREN